MAAKHTAKASVIQSGRIAGTPSPKAIIDLSGTANFESLLKSGESDGWHLLKLYVIATTPDATLTFNCIRSSCGEYLSAAGHAPKLAQQGTFDLGVSDLGLPDQSGLEWIRQSKEAYGLKGIAVSGYGIEEDIQRSRDAGFIQHLTKPVHMDRLREAIWQVL